MILKGYLSGGTATFYSPTINPQNLWDFKKNPVLNYNSFDNIYILISKYMGVNEQYTENFYNIQIVYGDDKNLLEKGFGLLFSDELKIILLETVNTQGQIKYDNANNNFNIYRYDNINNIVDNGNFEIIAEELFTYETGLKT